MTDITEHPTREGKIYCCVVLDAFSRMVVGWAIDSTQTTALVTTALGMATSTRNPDSGLVLHSDRGVQFTSWAFSRKLQDAGLAPSMGAVGAPGDNAMVESFWGRMQVELLDRKRWKTRDRARDRDPRLHRDLPQHHKTPQRAKHAHTNRIREPLPINHRHRLTPNPQLRKNRGRSLERLGRRLGRGGSSAEFEAAVPTGVSL
jgi:transposase InsO family protein